MTAQVEGERAGPIEFFTGKPDAVVEHLSQDRRKIAAFSAKDHSLCASISGSLVVDNDRAVIARRWNPFVAAWFDGKDDPKLVLLRFDAEHAEVWLNENGLLAGVEMLLGVDPKRDHAEKNAEVDLT